MRNSSLNPSHRCRPDLKLANACLNIATFTIHQNTAGSNTIVTLLTKRLPVYECMSNNRPVGDPEAMPYKRVKVCKTVDCGRTARATAPHVVCPSPLCQEGISTRGICGYCRSVKRRRGGELAQVTTVRTPQQNHGILANMLSTMNDACPCKAERVRILEGQDQELPL